MAGFNPLEDSSDPRPRYFYIFIVCYSFLGPCFSALYYFEYNATVTAMATLTCSLIIAFSYVLKTSIIKEYSLAFMNWCILVFSANLFLVTLATGFLDSPAIYWTAMVPLCAAFLTNRSWVITWSLISIIVLIAEYILATQGISIANELTGQDLKLINLLSFIGMTLSAGLITVTTDKVKDQFLEEKKMIETVLFNNSKLSTLGEMAAAIIHELKNPISINKTAINQVRSSLEKGEIDKANLKLDMIEMATDRSHKIIEGLRKYSRSSQYNEQTVITLSEVIGDSLLFVEPKLNKYGVEFDVDVQSKGQIKVNQIELSQVIINLINNSVDAVKDYKKPWVKLSIMELENFVEFRVVDCGKGIPQEVAVKIFESQFTTKSAEEGTGLGLSISKAIIENLKGKLYYDEKFPNTCFVIQIPKFKGAPSEEKEREVPNYH